MGRVIDALIAYRILKLLVTPLEYIKNNSHLFKLYARERNDWFRNRSKRNGRIKKDIKWEES